MKYIVVDKCVFLIGWVYNIFLGVKEKVMRVMGWSSDLFLC